MGNNKCAYFNCENNKSNRKDLTFFSFPTKNLSCCGVWQKNCGNIRIAHKDLDDLKYNYLCEVHFLKTDFRISSNRKLLNKNAVPINYQDTTIKIEIEAETPVKREYSSFPISSYDEEESFIFPSVQDPNMHEPKNETYVSQLNDDPCTSTFMIDPASIIKTYLPQKRKHCSSLLPEIGSDNHSKTSLAVSQELINMPNERVKLPPNYENLTHTVTDLKKKLTNMRKSYNRLKNKMRSYSRYATISNILKNKNIDVQTFVKMQCFHKSKTLWSSKEKQLSLSIYHKSPSVYQFMREKLQFVLPGARTIQYWCRVAK